MKINQQKLKRAEEFLKKVRAGGHNPELEGDWIVWNPPLTVDETLDCAEIANEIGHLLRLENK